MKKSQLPSDCGNYPDDEIEDIADDRGGIIFHTAWFISIIIGVIFLFYLIFKLFLL